MSEGATDSLTMQPPSPGDSEVQSAFLDAIELAPPDRSEVLARIGDPASRQRVTELLAAHDRLAASAPRRGLGVEQSVGEHSNQLLPPTLARLSSLAGITIGDFVIERPLGLGSHGIVYAARQSRPDRLVALKVMARHLDSSRARQRFELEGEVIARLRHPGIAHVYSCGVTEVDGVSVPWFAMELVEGASTITRYTEARDPSLHERLNLMAAVCDIVQFGHQNGVLHRDLKPANILVDDRGQLKVIDFGVAGSATPGAALPGGLAQDGTITGTLAYMAPEQCAAEQSRAVDGRADVFALGSILFEVLTGRPALPPLARALPAALRTAAETPRPRASTINQSIPRDVDAIVSRALALNASDRYPTPAALAADLRAVLAHQPVSARPRTPIYLAARFLRRRWVPTISVAAVIAALASATVLSLNALKREREARAEESTRAAELATALAQLEAESKVSAAAVQFLAKNVVGAMPARAGKPDATVRESLLVAVKAIPAAARGDPRAEFELHKIAAEALVGFSEFGPAAAEFTAAIAIMDDHPDLPLLEDPERVSLLSTAGLTLGVMKDARAPDLQLRAWSEAKERLGQGHASTIRAGSAYLVGVTRRDGFAVHRDEHESLYATAVSSLGVDVPATKTVRQSLAKQLIWSGAADRQRGRELAELEVASAGRVADATGIDNANRLLLDAMVAAGDPTALEFGKSQLESTVAKYGASSAQSQLVRTRYLMALRHAGDWAAMHPIAEQHALGLDTGAHVLTADKMDAWLELAVAAAEVGDRDCAERALERATEHEAAIIDPTSQRPTLARLEKARVRALLGTPGDLPACIADLKGARTAINPDRPLTVRALTEALGIEARLAFQGGDTVTGAALAREYLAALERDGVQPGWLATELRRRLDQQPGG